MMRALWSSASGMIAQQKNIDVISNNIANVNTVGFKGSRADFQDLVYQVIRPAGAINLAGAQIPTGIEIGHGTQLVATPTRFAQGDFKETEDSLDLAIQGKDFSGFDCLTAEKPTLAPVLSAVIVRGTL